MIGERVAAILLVVLCYEANLICAWNQWQYTTTWTSSAQSATEYLTATTVWNGLWNPNPGQFHGSNNPPRPRRGHSLHLIKTESESIYKGDMYLVMFGGRDNDQKTQHIPKTYDVKEVNGSIVFTTYDQKPVDKCNDINNDYYTKADQKTCSGNVNDTSIIDVGLFYNDVWAYKVCMPGPLGRNWDGACVETGWELWSPGAAEGGCTIQLGILVCTTPAERYNHGSVLFDDGTLYVYGGFSKRCDDYCDDLWYFDIYKKAWREIYGTGKLSKFHTDVYNQVNYDLDPAMVPIDNSTMPAKYYLSPNNRFRAYDDPTTPGQKLQNFSMYGGHRLWHGYSPENSQDNNWDIYYTRQRGGYLDDLWVYTKVLDFKTYPGSSFKKVNGNWTILQAISQCVPSPGLAWSQRFDQTCTITAPVGRGGHGSAYDTARGRVWIYGGYTSYYPYLKTDGAGSGPGVSSVGSGGFIPYPGYEFFRSDFWYFDFNSSTWNEITYPVGAAVPDGRVDPVFLLMGDIILLHGGYADNHIYSDTWYFNITTGLWLKKSKFVYPLYEQDCTDDLEYIQQNECVLLDYPRHLNRSMNFPFGVLPYINQSYYWPNSKFGPFYGIQPKDSVNSTFMLNMTQFAPVGTPEYPFAATGPMQYVRPVVYYYTNSSGFNVSIILNESCTSVFGVPTRGMKLDGLHGRAKKDIYIAQPRRQRPGWDGCTGRQDARKDLPQQLQYIMPTGRFGHRAVFVNDTNEILMYGGMAYQVDQPLALDITYYAEVVDEFWYFNLFHCINNCSGVGTCYYGFCICLDGYYGEDCSNTSCPGTFCYYDQTILQQFCYHGCQAGYNHTDNDTYVPDIPKVACSLNTVNSFELNGVCDGFGSSQCAPPFVGDDCSIKDCRNNCSFNGWCSIEYPVSRCMCMPGYYGEICELKICLNNCSYPNGACNSTSGECKCRMMYSPYNNTRAFHPWGGDDCSFLFAYAAAHSRQLINLFNPNRTSTLSDLHLFKFSPVSVSLAVCVSALLLFVFIAQLSDAWEEGDAQPLDRVG